MKTVYLVDDSILILERLGEILSGLRETRVIGQTGDPTEALRAILELEPDIAILDIQLPGKSGLELLKEIKAAGLKTHVVILTNFAYPQYQRECLEAGADFFLSKVIDFDLLPSIIRSFDLSTEPNGALPENRSASRLPRENKPP